jgi:hypothetical protein
LTSNLPYLVRIVNLYQDCERELSEWQGLFNDEREITASTDPNVAAAWGTSSSLRIYLLLIRSGSGSAYPFRASVSLIFDVG